MNCVLKRASSIGYIGIIGNELCFETCVGALGASSVCLERAGGTRLAHIIAIHRRLRPRPAGALACHRRPGVGIGSGHGVPRAYHTRTGPMTVDLALQRARHAGIVAITAHSARRRRGAERARVADVPHCIVPGPTGFTAHAIGCDRMPMSSVAVLYFRYWPNMRSGLPPLPAGTHRAQGALSTHAPALRSSSNLRRKPNLVDIGHVTTRDLPR